MNTGIILQVSINQCVAFEEPFLSSTVSQYFSRFWPTPMDYLRPAKATDYWSSGSSGVRRRGLGTNGSSSVISGRLAADRKRVGLAANAAARAPAGIQSGRWRWEKLGPSGPLSEPCCVMSLVCVEGREEGKICSKGWGGGERLWDQRCEICPIWGFDAGSGENYSQSKSGRVLPHYSHLSAPLKFTYRISAGICRDECMSVFLCCKGPLMYIAVHRGTIKGPDPLWLCPVHFPETSIIQDPPTYTHTLPHPHPRGRP